MNCLTDRLSPTPMLDEPTLESALSVCGWEQHGQTCWRLATSCSESWLTEIAYRDQWRQFELSGGATPQSTSARVLQENHRLFGPAKLVARGDGSTICRLDLPDELAASTGELRDTGDVWQVLHPQVAWAQAVTACATGCYESANSDKASEVAAVSDLAIADELKRVGWSTSIDGGRMVVHVQLPGVYRQMAVERDDLAGVKLAVDLIDLANLEEASTQAMLELAGEANVRLPLVRLAVAESSPSATLRAEVSFGATLIPGTMLLHSLHVLEAAVALTVQELEALRDAELARLVLAARAVRSSH